MNKSWEFKSKMREMRKVVRIRALWANTSEFVRIWVIQKELQVSVTAIQQSNISMIMKVSYMLSINLLLRYRRMYIRLSICASALRRLKGSKGRPKFMGRTVWSSRLEEGYCLKFLQENALYSLYRPVLTNDTTNKPNAEQSPSDRKSLQGARLQGWATWPKSSGQGCQDGKTSPTLEVLFAGHCSIRIFFRDKFVLLSGIKLPSLASSSTDYCTNTYLKYGVTLRSTIKIRAGINVYHFHQYRAWSMFPGLFTYRP